MCQTDETVRRSGVRKQQFSDMSRKSRSVRRCIAARMRVIPVRFAERRARAADAPDEIISPPRNRAVRVIDNGRRARTARDVYLSRIRSVRNTGTHEVQNVLSRIVYIVRLQYKTVADYAVVNDLRLRLRASRDVRRGLNRQHAQLRYVRAVELTLRVRLLSESGRNRRDSQRVKLWVCVRTDNRRKRRSRRRGYKLHLRCITRLSCVCECRHLSGLLPQRAPYGERQQFVLHCILTTECDFDLKMFAPRRRWLVVRISRRRLPEVIAVHPQRIGRRTLN